MIIKKFQGKTEAEAVESAKKELGSNVVIMNVRNMKRKGMFSFLKPQMIEVTVALEEEPEQSSIPLKEEAVKKPIIDAIVHKAAMETAVSIDNNMTKDAVVENSRQDSSAIEEKLDTLHTLLEQQLQKPDETTGDTLEKEEESEVERFMKLLYNTMLTNEVSEQNANQIIDEIEKINKPNMPFDYALANTYQKMILKFGKPIEITPAEKGPKVIFFYRTDRRWENVDYCNDCLQIQCGKR